jgi:glycerol-3-phosphate dehydrogenase subunit B
MSNLPVTERDLFVVGTGIAGMSAAVYAAKRGLSVF